MGGTGRTRTRTGKTSRTSNTDLERDRQRWTFTISAMDPDDGYDIMNDSEIEGTTITSRTRQSEIEMEPGGGAISAQAHDGNEDEDDEEDDYRFDDSPTVPPSAVARDENSEVMVGQRIMDQGTIDDIEAAGVGAEDPDRIRRCNRQDSITMGDYDDLRHSLRQQSR